MKLEDMGNKLVEAGAFAGVGIVVFAVAFWLMTKVTPFSVRKEIEEDQNTALAIIFAGVIIGISLIIASAVSGS
jgi:putative membrane protein